MDYVDLVLRWIHILSAVTVAGGIIFWRFVLMPAAYSLPENERQNILEASRGRWAKLVMLGTAALLVTGLVNAVRMITANTFGVHPYHTLVLIKLILAMAFFYIAARLSGRSEAAGRFRDRLPFWLNITLALVLALVLVGGYMKNIPRFAKPGAANTLATPAAAEQP
jgi:uncharacterized membrane protein